MESHYPQTDEQQHNAVESFFYRMESHYPQTKSITRFEVCVFFYRMESHYPQTEKTLNIYILKVFLPYGITLPSNEPFAK